MKCVVPFADESTVDKTSAKSLSKFVNVSAQINTLPFPSETSCITKFKLTITKSEPSN